MKWGKKIVILLVANIMLALAIPVSLTWAEEYASSEILVKFKAPTKKAEAKSASKFRWKMKAVEVRKFVINNVRQMKLPAGKSVEQSILDAYQDPNVEYAEPNYVIHVNKIPDDPMYNQLWGMEKISVEQAWDLSTGSNQIIIAIIDTGVDYTHPDLANSMWTAPDGEHGYDFCNEDSDPIDDNGHGTHVAGTIGAVANNNMGVSGVCWNVKIMALKFLDANGTGYLSDAISAIQYATDNGANILSNSWGGGGYSQAMKDAITASSNAGKLFIVSAGNNSTNNDIYPQYPSNYDVPNIIVVAATDQNDNLAYFSCYGQHSVDLAAPGVSVLSTIPGNQYDSFSGTSMACPHVSGVCGLIWAQNPDWTNLQVKERLLQSVDQPSSLLGKVLTNGRLNAYKALGGGTQSPDPSELPDPSSDNVIFYDDMESGTSKWSYVGSPWAMVDAESYSPTHSFDDSPGGDYGNNVHADITTQAIDFSGYDSVTLTFWHKYQLETGYDYGTVYITTDDWATYTELAYYTGTQTSWTQVVIDLSEFTGNTNAKICFEVWTDETITLDGWYIDDVTITASTPEPPPPPPPPPPVDQPNIEIDPVSIPEVEVVKDGIITQYIKIKNTGDVELNYSISKHNATAVSEVYPYEPGPEEEVQVNTLTVDNTKWQVIFNKRTGTVHRAYGGSLGLTGLSSENMDKARMDHLSRGFVSQHYNLLKVDVNDLKLLRNERHSHQWYVTFQQMLNNIPVYNAKVELRYNTKTGQLILFGSDAYPDIDVSTTPSITAETVQEIVKNDAGFNAEGDQLRSTQLFVFPAENQDNIEYYLAYQVILFTESPPHLWIYIINAIDGSIIEKRDGIRHLDITGTVRGKVHPFYPSDKQVLEEFMGETVNVSGANSCYTDENGYYNTSVSDSDYHTIATAFDGPFVYTINQGGPDSNYTGYATGGIPHDIEWDDSNSDVTERDVYYHSMVSILKIKQIDPDFTGVDYYAPSKVNIPNYTNAYFDGYGYGYGDGNDPNYPWVNLGQVCDSMYHEYGHGIMHFQYNQYWGGSLEFDSMHEGTADYFACTITNEPLIGEELGLGIAWRNIDEPNATPSNTIPECHDRGRVIGGALWDLRKELGAELTDHLFHFARYGQSLNFYDYYIDFLLEDDDDGNYNNGTPHSEEIYSAFALHDIAYVVPGDPNDITAPAEVNDLAAIDSIYNTITLQWTAPGDDGNTGQAHSYDIRYSTTQITNSNWNQANQLANEPYPKKSGITESVNISGLDPDTIYYLALKARDNKGNWSLLSNTASRKTLSSLTIYTNDMEQDTSDWIADGTWGVVSANAHSGIYCWTDSPNGNYENNTNSSLVSPSFDLIGFIDTSLSFWHKYSLENEYDICYVEVSGDDGISWKAIKSFNGQNPDWTKVTINLSAYDGKSNVKIRFKLYSNFAGNYDGWYIDDVKIMSGDYFKVEPDWLMYAPESGTIPAGSEQLTRITYNADGLELGTYEQTIYVISNDPDTPQLELKAIMTVVEPTFFPPSVPTGLQAAVGDKKVELNWDANTDSEIAGYNIYRKAGISQMAIRTQGELASEVETKLDESLNLVKVFLTEKTDIDSLLNLGIAVYANMGIYAIAEVTYGELDKLSDLGFTYRILDTNSQAKQYYMAWTPIKENMAIIYDYATVLERDTSTAIIYIDQNTTKQIHQLGFRLISIKRKPLVPGEKTITSYGLFSLADTSEQSLINEMVTKVQETNVRNYIQTLQDFNTRYIWTDVYDQSAEYALNEFQDMGLDVEYHQFHLLEDNTIIKNNVVATLTGTSKPDEIFIICAHLDTTTAALDSGGGDESNAPGTEDNGSGSAVVLEAARILSQYEFDSTIKFILFGAEEEWFEGSETYVNEMADSGANIAGVFNLDMIAYLDTPDWDLSIVSHPSWQELPNTIVQAANTYTEIQAYNLVDGSAGWSDHWFFWQRGYPAIVAIEYMSSHFYPWYHTTEDTIDKISTPFAAEVAKLGLATLAELANPVTSPSPVPVYEKINNTLVTTTSYNDTNVTNNTSYLYVVTAVNTSSKESSYSNEVSATPDDITSPSGLPSISITSPANGAVFITPKINVSGTIDDESSTVTINGVSAVVSSGTFGASSIPLLEGSNIVTATATNQYGSSSSYSITVILNTTTLSKITGLGAIDTPEDNGCSITLTWTHNTENGLNHYNIYRSINPITNVSGINVLGAAQPNKFIDNKTIDKTNYYYAVTAVDDFGNEDNEVIDVGPVFSLDNLYY